MPKTCSHSDCSAAVFSKHLCRFHWGALYAKPLKKNNSPASKRKAKPRKPIPKVSAARRSRLALYQVAREQLLKERPFCEMKLEGCTIKATEVHHKGGRENEKLLDMSKCLACCSSCHQKITENSAYAVENGLSEYRNRK